MGKVGCVRTVMSNILRQKANNCGVDTQKAAAINELIAVYPIGKFNITGSFKIIARGLVALGDLRRGPVRKVIAENPVTLLQENYRK